MIEYSQDNEFQRKILYLLVRKPELRDIIGAQYFKNPLHMNIARWVCETYEKYPKTRLSKTTVKTLVKGGLGKKRKDVWPKYKDEIRRLFNLPTKDDEVVLGQVETFVNETKRRQGLVKLEKAINDKNQAEVRRVAHELANIGATEELPEQHNYDWPKHLEKDAFQGLAGEIVEAILPCTEADAAGLLLQLLVGFGNIVGHRRYIRVGEAKHFPNLNCLLVGTTAKARKGTAWSEIRPFLKELDHGWAKEGILHGGLASGEGLIWAVRDPIEKLNAKKKQTKTIDPGVSDKRKLVISTEFSSVIRVMQREGSILSEVVRQAFDGSDLNNQSKVSPARATGAHISVIGHITQGETLRTLGRLEGGNGFVNRFLWTCVRRTKSLSDPPKMDTKLRTSLEDKLRSALDFARKPHEVERSKRAKKLWDHVYQNLFKESPGLIGEITARGDAHVTRLSLVYALLDRSEKIRTKHLKAAVAVWKYCEESARFIFGETLGYPDAEKVLKAVQQSSKGLSRSEISQSVFQGHKTAEQLESILKHLKDRQLIDQENLRTEGRPKQVWKANKGKAPAK